SSCARALPVMPSLLAVDDAVETPRAPCVYSRERRLNVEVSTTLRQCTDSLEVCAMRSLLVPLALASAAVLPTLATVSPAEARIVCKDGFQLSGGAWISTPYCNDEYLATVARRHGVNV